MILETWMRKRKLNKLLLIYLLFLCVPLFAKGSEGLIDSHVIDMLKVLGLFMDPPNSISYNNFNTLEPLFYKYNHFYIDTLNVPESDGIDGVTDDFYNKIKNNFSFAYEQKLTHRELYHWGFDFDTDLTIEGIPTDDQIPQALNDTFRLWNGDEAVSDWYRFLKFLRDEQAKRNDSFIQSLRSALGVRSYYEARDIAAVLYYTHILGDHIEHSGPDSAKGILELDKIQRNLDLHIKSLSKKCDWLYSDVKKINASNEMDKAQKILDCLIDTIPEILKYKYAKEFASKNLKFCFNKNRRAAA